MVKLKSYWVVEFDINFLIHILVIYVLCYVRDAVVLVENNFTVHVIRLPNSVVLFNSTFAIFDLFDDIEIFLITLSMRS